MRQSRIFCLPSHGEGTPNSVMEALSCGLPIVATDVGGISDIVEHEKTGLLVNKGDVENLANSLIALLNDYDRCVDMGKAAQLFARDHLDARKTVRRLVDLYSELITTCTEKEQKVSRLDQADCLFLLRLEGSLVNKQNKEDRRRPGEEDVPVLSPLLMSVLGSEKKEELSRNGSFYRAQKYGGGASDTKSGSKRSSLGKLKIRVTVTAIQLIMPRVNTLNQIKVVHLTSVHRPFDVRIFHKECMTLAKAGYEVVLIAPHQGDQTFNKVRTRMVPQPRSRLERMIRTTWQIFRAALNERANVYHFHDPELIPVGLLLRLLGKRVVYDAHEEVPKQILSKYWIPPWLRGWVADLAGAAELLGGLSFDAVVAATPAIGKRFPREKTFVVQNFPIPDELASDGFASYAERPFTVTYIGGMSAVRGIKEIIHAIDIIPESLRVRLVLAGAFDPPELEDEVKKITGWGRVDFWGGGLGRVLREC